MGNVGFPIDFLLRGLGVREVPLIGFLGFFLFVVDGSVVFFLLGGLPVLFFLKGVLAWLVLLPFYCVLRGR
jgi:hypothetical protein